MAQGNFCNLIEKPLEQFLSRSNKLKYLGHIPNGCFLKLKANTYDLHPQVA